MHIGIQIFIFTLGAAAFAGCAAGAQAPAPATTAVAFCTAVALPASLVYPAPGATVPDAPGVLVVAGAVTSVDLSGGAPLHLTTTVAVPSPLPVPNATPSPGLPLVAFSVPPLNAAATYAVHVNGTAGVCLTGNDVGSFKTQ